MIEFNQIQKLIPFNKANLSTALNDFDLEALKTYYPKGMIKSKCFNFSDFAKNILKLLDDKKLYQKYGQQRRRKYLFLCKGAAAVFMIVFTM